MRVAPIGLFYPKDKAFKIAVEASALTHDNIAPNEVIPQIGEGWVGEEALAIEVYCSLKYQNNFKQALIAAVNHDGDSDSTGAITGNTLGAFMGYSKIPIEWIEKVELRNEVIQIADDLLIRHKYDNGWWDRYPGY